MTAPSSRPSPAGAAGKDPADFLEHADDLTLSEIREAAAGCTSCPLYRNATQTVFGEGPENARVLFVGEQPGDQEDVQGRPFVGPAGRILNRAMEDAGIDRSTAYVTNTVKHFKYLPRGKRRLHARPSAGEISVCKPWVLAEILKVRPRAVVCLGATACQALIRRDFRLTRERGRVPESDLAPLVVATVHPSFLLRVPEERKQEEFGLFVEDLRLAAALGR